MNTRIEKPKISTVAKTFAQSVWTGVSDEEISHRIDCDLNLFKERALILEKIEGIRKDARQRGKVVDIPKDGTVGATPISTTISVTAIEPVIAGTVEKKQTSRGKTLWPREDSPDVKNANKLIELGHRIVKEKMHAKKEKPASVSANTERGHIINLMQATKESFIRKSIKNLKGEDEGIKIETFIYPGIHDALGVEINVDEAIVSKMNGVLTFQIGDLRVTGVPPEEISGNTLRGLFHLDVVARRRSDEGKFALFPKLAFLEHLNGTKPVFIAKIDQEKKEPAPCSFHTTPSFHGEILHLELKAE